MFIYICTQPPGEWAFISGHTLVKSEQGGEMVPAPLPLSPDHQQYYHRLFSVIVGPSNDLFKVSYLTYFTQCI